MVNNYCYKQVVTSRLGITNGAEDTPVKPRQLLQLSRISFGAVLHASLDEFVAILSAPQCSLPSAFAILPIPTFRYFANAVWDCVEGFSGIGLPHCFYTAARVEMSLRVIEGLRTEFIVRERVPLLDESTMGAPCNLDRSFVRRVHLSDTVAEVHTSWARYHHFDSIHNTSETDLFTGETTVWVHASTSTPPGLFMTVRLC